ncbi:hypothetical protein M3231_02485 [Neobacillus mesonae]|nr:hypothetical protein [Neobacillus mesonae]
MNELSQLMGRLQDWSEGILLRGFNQLTPADLESLKVLSEDAARLDMDFLCSLLDQTITEGRVTLEQNQFPQSFMFHYSRLCEYIAMAQETDYT